MSLRYYCPKCSTVLCTETAHAIRFHFLCPTCRAKEMAQVRLENFRDIVDNFRRSLVSAHVEFGHRGDDVQEDFYEIVRAIAQIATNYAKPAQPATD